MKEVDALLEEVRLACAAADCEHAVDLLEKAVRIQPADYQLHYWLGVCHSGGCRRHGYTDPDLAVEYLRQALRLARGATPLGRAAILAALGNTCLDSHSLKRTEAVRTSIECHRQAAQIYHGLGQAEAWAREKFNCGNACCELSELAGEDHWQEAISCYEGALTVRTRERNPERYASVLENLGTAYRQLPAGDHGRNVRTSIGCYRHALRICGRATHPARNAALHGNLGNAYLSLPASDETARERNARRALRHFERALHTPGCDRDSRQYAINQHNRAQAYLRLSDFEASMDCLQEAYRVFMACGEEIYARRIRAQMENIHRTARKEN
jgi:tetratricopeptide (TPR) repeat protein